jgi:Family of unknown function (DUF6159)
MQGGRFSRGWALAKRSWTILRGDRALLLFPLIAAAATVVAALVLVGPAAALWFSGTSKPAGVALALIGGYAVTFLALYCNTALAAAAAESLDGRPATVGAGFAIARTHRGAIAQWALVQLTVGLLLQALERLLSNVGAGQLVVALVRSLLGAAWAIATFFVVPVLALEGLGPRAALRRSGEVVRARWGEGLVGSGSIAGVVLLLGLLPAVALGALGVALVSSAPAGGALLLAVAVLLFAGAILIGSTLSAIFRVALFRFATDGRVVGGYDPGVLEAAFRPKRRRR